MAVCCIDADFIGVDWDTVLKIRDRGVWTMVDRQIFGDLVTKKQLKFSMARNAGRRPEYDEVHQVLICDSIKLADRFDIALEGPCPNLGNDGNCVIWQVRPNVCDNLELGGRQCICVRRRNLIEV